MQDSDLSFSLYTSFWSHLLKATGMRPSIFKVLCVFINGWTKISSLLHKPLFSFLVNRIYSLPTNHIGIGIGIDGNMLTSTPILFRFKYCTITSCPPTSCLSHIDTIKPEKILYSFDLCLWHAKYQDPICYHSNDISLSLSSLAHMSKQPSHCS